MADGKREHDFDVALNLTMFVKQAMWHRFDPTHMNPYSEPVEYEDLRTDEEKKEDTKAGIQEIKMGLAAMLGRRSVN